MRTKLVVFAVFSLIVFMIAPAYANVTSVSLEKSYYTNEEKMVFIGKEQEGKKTVVVIIRDSSGVFKGMLSDFLSESDGTFSTTPTEKSLTKFFDSKGTYNATAFTNEQKEENGITIKLQYDGNKVLVVPDFALAFNSIPDKTIEEEKTLEFTPTLTESLTGIIFSLEKNPPTGSSINNETGKFTWTPEASQGPASYAFDIVVKKGALEDRENVMITVIEPISGTQPESTQEPEPTPVTEPEPTPEPTSGIESKELGIASFVDPTKDPQSYVNRYNNEPKYKEWFDKTYPDMTIYDAVGLDESKIKEQESGQCGPGTKLVDGVCAVDDNLKEGGGCLIATATYGSEMAPQVQFLREIRDNKVMSTTSGVSFMTGFNQLYYSFSPTIADLERESPIFKEIVKLGLTPMLSSLSIMSAADSEQEILGYGVGVILMNVGMYFVAPAMLFYSIKKAKTRLSF